MTATASPPAPRTTYQPHAPMRPEGSRSAAAPVRPEGFSPLGFALRHWFYLLFCTLVSGAAAWYAAQEFTVQTYNFEAQLLYNRIGSESLGYEAPWLTALAPLVESRSVLDHVRQDLNLTTDLETFEKAIEVEVPYDSSLFTVALKWPRRDQGKEVLDRVVGRFTDVVAMSRNSAIEVTSTGLNGSMYDINRRLDSAREQIHEFNDRYHVLDLERDLLTLKTEIDLLDNALSRARQRVEGQQAQLASLSGEDSGDNAPTPTQLTAARNSMDLERWRVLRDVISEEERRIQQQATLDFQLKEYERAKLLREKSLISEADFDAISMQLQTLKSMNDPSLTGLRNQLESVEQKVPGVLQSGLLNTTAFSSSTNLRAQVELTLIASEVEVTHLAEDVKQKRQRLDELVNARMEGQSLEAELKSLMDEKKRLRERQTDLQNVRVEKPIEFSVVQSAAPSLKEVDSNRKKLLVGVFGTCMMLLVGPLLLRDSLVARRNVERSAAL